MHLCPSFLILLLLTWMEQGASTVCNAKALTKEKKGLLALFDKIEVAISPSLPSKEIKDLVHDINEKLKSGLCDVYIEEKAMQEIVKTGNGILNKALNKTTDIGDIIAFLVKGVFDNLDNMISTLMNKPDNRIPLQNPKFPKF